MVSLCGAAVIKVFAKNINNMPPLKINIAQITVIQQLDRELKLYMSGGHIVKITGSNEQVDRMAKELSANLLAVEGETSTQIRDHSGDQLLSM